MDSTTSDYLTPVERYGAVWLKREDAYQYAGMRGGKVRTCALLAANAKVGLVTACARQSPQGAIVAKVAQARGLACWIHTPDGCETIELVAAREAGAVRVAHRGRYTSVITARAREHADAMSATLIPFGMESHAAVEATAKQTANLPLEAERLIVPVGSGMSLSGILWGLVRNRIRLPVVGVVVGAAPERRLDRWAPPDWRRTVEIARTTARYSTAATRTEQFGVAFDPYYEAKCLPFLRSGDCLWVVGIR